MSPPKVKVSPSRLKSLDLCSYKFYCNEILKLPEKPNPKTLVGTLVHAIFEGLVAKKRTKVFTSIMVDGWAKQNDIHLNVRRWCRLFGQHHGIAVNEDEVIDMLGVAFRGVKPHWYEGWVYWSERRYEMDLGGFVISGVIDLLVQTKDGGYVVIDLKTAGQRFSNDEVINSYQSISYQLFVWKTYKVSPRVEYLMLRHPPTKRSPARHLQVTNPAPEAAYAGFEVYLRAAYAHLNPFSLEKAYSNFCSKPFFCDKVCQFKKPFQYQSVTHPDRPGEVVNYLMDKKVELKPGEKLEIRAYSGCPRFNS